MTVWSQSAKSGGGLYTGEVYARRFRADGTPLDAKEFQVNNVQVGRQFMGALAAHAGKLVVTWKDVPASGINYYGQAFSWDDTLLPLGGNFPIPDGGDGGVTGAAIDPQGSNFTLVWTQLGNSTGNTYYQKFTGLNLVPTGFSLLYDSSSGLTGSVSSFSDNLPVGDGIGNFQSYQTGNWTYYLVPGQGSNDNGDFLIINGELVANTAFNVNTQSEFSIRVRAVPDSGLSQEEVFNFSATGTFADGLVVTNFSPMAPSLDYVFAAAIQADGKVVVAGDQSAGNATTTIARYNPDGSLDPGFGGTGRVVSQVLAGFNYAEGVAIQPDGKIVVVGTGSQPSLNEDVIYITRYNTDGTLDTAFGTGGVLISPFNGSGGMHAAVAVQSNGMIVVACETPGPGPVKVLRYNAAGVLDSTFGSGGIATLAPAASYQSVLGLKIDPAGNIIVVGNTTVGGKRYAFVERLLPSGSPDTKFSGVGYETLSQVSYSTNGYSLCASVRRQVTDRRQLWGPPPQQQWHHGYDLGGHRFGNDHPRLDLGRSHQFAPRGAGQQGAGRGLGIQWDQLRFRFHSLPAQRHRGPEAAKGLWRQRLRRGDDAVAGRKGRPSRRHDSRHG